MTVSIVVLKTGEKLITDLREAFESIDGEEKNERGICLVFKRPYELFLREVDTDDNLDLQVEFSKWCPFAIDTEYKIPYDSVMAIAQPDPNLASAYERKVSMIEELESTTESNFQIQQNEIQNALEQIKTTPPQKDA
jgi:hypothetical protein